MPILVYAQFGREPANPVNATAICNQCLPTLMFAGLDGLRFDTEKDARAATMHRVLQPAIVADYAPRLWTQLWNGFRCNNGQCRNKAACGNRPTFLMLGAEPMPTPPANNIMWQLVMGMAREIQCLPGGPGTDVPPEFPDLTTVPPPTVPLPPGGFMPQPPGVTPLPGSWRFAGWLAASSVRVSAPGGAKPKEQRRVKAGRPRRKGG